MIFVGVKVLFWGPKPPAVPPDPNSSPLDLLSLSGKNLGNYIFVDAVYHQINFEKADWLRDWGDLPQLAQEYDALVLPASNWLYPGYDWSWLVPQLEKLSLPIIIIGVGVQWNKKDLSDFYLPESTVRMMKIISERSAYIGVRGYFSAEILAHYGIKNVEVIGCPSLYNFRNPALYIPKNTEIKQIAVNLSRPVARHSFDPLQMKKVEGILLQEAMKYNGSYILQSEVEEMFICFGQEGSAPHDVWSPIKAYYENIPLDDLKRYLRSKTKVLLPLPLWEQEIQGCDFVFGTRIHGCFIAIRNMVPAFVVVHDLRTLELCQFFGIPYRLITDEDFEFTVAHMYEQANFSTFEANYPSLFQRYISFLIKNGLPPKL